MRHRPARYDRDEVLARVDLVGLADRLLGPRNPRTKSWTCPNLDHAQTGRTPPVSIFTDRRGGQRWHCHGCGDGGTAIDLTIRAGPARDFCEALEWLAGQAHVSPFSEVVRSRRQHRSAFERRHAPDGQVRMVLSEYADGCFEYLRSPAGLEVRQWLTKARAIPQAILDHAGVGADPGISNLPRADGIPRISPAAVFPIRDQGEAIFTLSRAIRPMGSLPRWVNTASSIAPNPRVAMFQCPGAGKGPIVVTEGVLDALSVVSASHDAAALLGTGIVDDDLADRLAELRRSLLIATDNDEAGRHARDRLNDLLRARGARTSTLEIPARYNDMNDWHVATGRWLESFATAVRLTDATTERAIQAAGLG